ncbi:unnamed protein product [Colias eurytheme]|nr:unnamed protein product [Colias eurytheme]
MYSPTTLREVTVVDGVRLIITSPPASDHRSADGSAHMWRPSPASPLRERLFSIRSSRGAVYSAPYIRAHGAPPRAGAPCAPARKLQVGARSSNRSDGRPPSALFWENTNLEWMVLASRKRTPPVESIFRAGLRLRMACAASARRAAITLCRLTPPRIYRQMT